MTSAKTRTEKDTFGPIEVPADRLWGAGLLTPEQFDEWVRPDEMVGR